jgi:hypothetical protein
VLDQPAADQRGQDAGDRAHVDAGAPGDLVRAQLGAGVRELAEDGHRPLHRGDLAGSWLAGSGHDMIFPKGK